MTLSTLRSCLSSELAVFRPVSLHLQWVKRAGTLFELLPEREFTPPRAPQESRIRRRMRRTEHIGDSSLAELYGEPGGTRRPDDVSVSPAIGRLFAWLAAQRKPELVVEFGTAFGASGMYWLAALEAAKHGTLFTFEINDAWAAVARPAV